MEYQKLSFTKMNGAGNDFVVLDNRSYQFSDKQLSALARKLCVRRTAVGADGLLALAAPSDRSRHDYRMRYFNADGSLATMCGNGARCLARFAYQKGVGSGRLRVESDAGTHHVDVPADKAADVRLFMPVPKQGPQVVQPKKQLPDESLAPVYSIWTGTEHAVCMVDNVNEVLVNDWGRRLREDNVFAPTGTNVNFVQILSNEKAKLTLRVRTFEKGVEGETLACGTGAVASAWTAHILSGSKAQRVAVHMPGGQLHVGWEKPDPTELYLEGEANITFVGTISLKL